MIWCVISSLTLWTMGSADAAAPAVGALPRGFSRPVASERSRGGFQRYRAQRTSGFGPLRVEEQASSFSLDGASQTGAVADLARLVSVKPSGRHDNEGREGD